METFLYLSLGLNIILLVICFANKKGMQELPKEKKLPTPEVPAQAKERPIINEQLKKIADECEAKLPEEDRGKVKLLVQYNNHKKLAILQIGDLRISLCRRGNNQSLFTINSFYEALQLARDGYDDGTARYIPVPSELETILAQRQIINVYLKALGLEQISEEDDFWCVNTETGWNTGWKRFDYDIDVAFKKLKHRSWIRTKKGQFLRLTDRPENAKLFLLLKGWEHMYSEV